MHRNFYYVNLDKVWMKSTKIVKIVSPTESHCSFINQYNIVCQNKENTVFTIYSNLVFLDTVQNEQTDFRKLKTFNFFIFFCITTSFSCYYKQCYIYIIFCWWWRNALFIVPLRHFPLKTWFKIYCIVIRTCLSKNCPHLFNNIRHDQLSSIGEGMDESWACWGWGDRGGRPWWVSGQWPLRVVGGERSIFISFFNVLFFFK